MKIRLDKRHAPVADDAIGLTADELARLELTPGTRVVVRVGNKQVLAKVQSLSPSAAGNIAMGDAVLRTLSLASTAARQFVYRVRKDAGPSLRIGPVIGILAGLTREELRQNRHGYKLFDTLWNIRNTGGIGYVFSLEDIDWERRVIIGHVHLADDVPSKTPPARIPLDSAPFPFPDAIYRRRSIPASALERIRAEMTPWVFNEGLAGNKFSQAQALVASGDLAHHVPDMRPLDAVEVLDKMLARYRAVFLKRRSLGAGKGIVRATKADAGGYVLTHRVSTREDREVSRTVKTFRQLTDHLADVTGYEWNDETWYVQRAITPARYKGRVFDLRVTVQKDGLGRWRVHGMYARIAPESSSVVTRRGDYRHARAFLNEVFPVRGRLVYAAAADLALRSAAVLDRDLGLIGDVGIDIMPDVGGRLWFIEGNPGPGYLSVGDNDPDYRRQVFAPVAFASYLAGFPIYRTD